jgi:GGDEF domain-containing protein
VSAGVAYLARERRKTLDEWISCSDQALYSAKQQGRNQVVVL